MASLFKWYFSSLSLHAVESQSVPSLTPCSSLSVVAGISLSTETTIVCTKYVEFSFDQRPAFLLRDLPLFRIRFRAVVSLFPVSGFKSRLFAQAISEICGTHQQVIRSITAAIERRETTTLLQLNPYSLQRNPDCPACPQHPQQGHGSLEYLQSHGKSAVW